MVAEIRFVNISGTQSGFLTSGAIMPVLLVGQSGTTFIPLRCTNNGILFTSGT